MIELNDVVSHRSLSNSFAQSLLMKYIYYLPKNKKKKMAFDGVTLRGK